MKDLKNFKGAKMLSKNDQRSIKGGVIQCDKFGHDCRPGFYCDWYNAYYGLCEPIIES